MRYDNVFRNYLMNINNKILVINYYKKVFDFSASIVGYINFRFSLQQISVLYFNNPFSIKKIYIMLFIIRNCFN